MARLDDGPEQRLFGLEVVEHRGSGDPDLFGDLLQRGGVVALAEEQVQGVLEDGVLVLGVSASGSFGSRACDPDATGCYGRHGV